MKSENYIKFIFWNISTQFSWIDLSVYLYILHRKTSQLIFIVISYIIITTYFQNAE